MKYIEWNNPKLGVETVQFVWLFVLYIVMSELERGWSYRLICCCMIDASTLTIDNSTPYIYCIHPLLSGNKKMIRSIHNSFTPVTLLSSGLFSGEGNLSYVMTGIIDETKTLLLL